MSEPGEKTDNHHFEASQVTPSTMHDELEKEIYHEDGALTVNVRDAHVDISGGRAAVKLAKDGAVSRFPGPPSL